MCDVDHAPVVPVLCQDMGFLLAIVVRENVVLYYLHNIRFRLFEEEWKVFFMITVKDSVYVLHRAASVAAIGTSRSFPFWNHGYE